LSDTSLRGRRYKKISEFREVEEVLAEVIPRIRVKPAVVTKRTRSAVGCILASNVYARRDLPPLPMSHVDGFAARSIDLRNASEDAPVGLLVEGSVGPGESGMKIGPGRVFRIHTGGYLPEGADTVIPQEDVFTDGSRIYVTRPYTPSENVVPAGSDVRRGQLMAGKGEALSPAKASLLETLGVYEVSVREGLRVSILSFGDELTDNPAEAERGKILNTHAVLVSEMARALCCDIVRAQIVPDRPEAVVAAIEEGIETSHLVLTIGGSSVGDIDLVGAELDRRSELFIQGLKLQPGRVGGIALIDGKPVVVLPGLIHSTVNVFNYLAAPVIAHMLETSLEQFIITVSARMAEPVELRRWLDFKRIVWVTLKRIDGGGYEANPNVADASNVSSIAHSHGFIEVPPNKPLITRGDNVAVRIPLWITRGIVGWSRSFIYSSKQDP